MAWGALAASSCCKLLWYVAWLSCITSVPAALTSSTHTYSRAIQIGDAYLVVSGILAPDAEGFNAIDEAHDAAGGARRVFAFAQDMLRVSRLVSG